MAFGLATAVVAITVPVALLLARPSEPQIAPPHGAAPPASELVAARVPASSAASQPAAPSPSPTRPSAQGAPVSSAEPPADNGAAGVAAAGDDDGRDLPEREGYLVVQVVPAAESQAHVYLGNVPVGPAGTRLRVPCGINHLRLGTYPEHRWLAEGRALAIKCRGVTTTTVQLGAGNAAQPGQ